MEDIIITRTTNNITLSSCSDSMTDVSRDSLLSGDANFLLVEDDTPLWLIITIALVSFVICYWMIFHLDTLAHIFFNTKIPPKSKIAPYPYDTSDKKV